MDKKYTIASYRPVILIYVAAVLFAFFWRRQIYDGRSYYTLIQSFMSAFLFAFSALKLRDIPGFATRFASYDLIAKRFKAYAYAYPFIELVLAFIFLLNSHRLHLVGDYVMFFIALMGIASVYASILRKQRLYCACLGTSFDLPLSYVAIFENVTMLAMSLLMMFVAFPAGHIH